MVGSEERFGACTLKKRPYLSAHLDQVLLHHIMFPPIAQTTQLDIDLLGFECLQHHHSVRTRPQWTLPYSPTSSHFCAAREFSRTKTESCKYYLTYETRTVFAHIWWLGKATQEMCRVIWWLRRENLILFSVWRWVMSFSIWCSGYKLSLFMLCLQWNLHIN